MWFLTFWTSVLHSKKEFLWLLGGLIHTTCKRGLIHTTCKVPNKYLLLHGSNLRACPHTSIIPSNHSAVSVVTAPLTTSTHNTAHTLAHLPVKNLLDSPFLAAFSRFINSGLDFGPASFHSTAPIQVPNSCQDKLTTTPWSLTVVKLSLVAPFWPSQLEHLCLNLNHKTAPWCLLFCSSEYIHFFPSSQESLPHYTFLLMLRLTPIFLRLVLATWQILCTPGCLGKLH